MIQKTQTNLTPRQMQALKIIAAYQLSNCYSITIQELSASLGVSRTTAFEHVAGLREKGLLCKPTGRVRSLSLTAKAQRLLKQNNFANDTEPSQPESIAVVGTVAAGMPIEAIEDTQRISLASEFGSPEDVFALKVSGNSMTGDGIFDGDHVVCRKANSAANGKIVIAMVDNDSATVKRFYKEPNRIRLEPSNPDFEPIFTNNCTIAGIVIGLMRKL